MTDLAVGSAIYAVHPPVAINERGQVIGYLGGAARLWSDGAAYDLSYGGSGFSRSLDDMNDLGQIVGYGNVHCTAPGPYSCIWDALLWDNGVLLNLGVQAGRWPNNPTLINNRGQIVIDNNGFPTLWHAGALIPFVNPSGWSAIATAINDDGLVVGYGTHALMWKIDPPPGQ